MQLSTAITDDLNEQQRAAVGYVGSVLVQSGAGTGKTRVITARICQLLSQGVPANEIFAVTFSNRAAKEMRERVFAALRTHGGPPARGLAVRTFHSFGMLLLQQHPEAAGLPHTFIVIDHTEQVTMVRRILQEEMHMATPTQGGPEPRAVCAYINRCKDAGLRADAVEWDSTTAGKNMRTAFELYENRRKREGKADFAELLLRPRELLQTDASIRKLWRERYTHILIDELQDVNALQLDILQLLRSARTVFFGVGDDDQSIYGFRGAKPRVLQQFAREFTQNKVLPLEHNYRSSEAILLLANKIIIENLDRFGNKRLRGHGRAGDKPTLKQHADDETEARAVARAVSVLCDQGIAPSQIGVLYRNNALSQLLETELTAQQIPFRIRGGVRFFARTEIKDAVAYLQVAANPEDLDAVMRSINMPPRKVGNKAKEKLQQLATTNSVWNTLRAAEHAGVQQYVQVIEHMQSFIASGDLRSAAQVAVTTSGLQAYWQERRQLERADNLDEVINAAARYQERGEGEGLLGFLNEVKLDSDRDDDGDQVMLMTMHAAKGLEFDYLFLVGLEYGILPSFQAQGNDINEDRRLLYVAITRARQQLSLSFALARRIRGFVTTMQCTYFLNKALKEGLLTPIDVVIPSSGTTPRRPGYAKHWTKPRNQPTHVATQRSIAGLRTGMRVRSEKLGMGVVLALSGTGEKAKANVLFFKDRKKRWLLLNLAQLQPA